MPTPKPCSRLRLLLRQLREIKGVKEKQPRQSSMRRSDAFIHFHVEAGALHADLKKPGGSGFDRYRWRRRPSSASWSRKRSCAPAIRRRLTTASAP